MPENHDLHDFGVLNPETHHESSDVNVRGILWFVVIFVAFAIVTHIFLYFLYAGSQKHCRTDIQPKRTAISVPAALPQTPRLQPFPRQDQRGSAIPPHARTPVVDMEGTGASAEQG